MKINQPFNQLIIQTYNKTLFKFLPGIAWFFVVFLLICLPGNDIPSQKWMEDIFFDKWMHAGMFSVLAFLFIWPIGTSFFSSRKKWKYFIGIALAACMWGFATECIQHFIPSRSFDLLDWAADSMGVLIALVFCKKYFLKKRRHLSH